MRRRLVAVPAVLALSVATLSACGDDAGESSGSVKVSGAFGTAPKVDFDGKLVRTESEYKVLTEGKGEEIKTGDTAYIEWYVGNGYNGKEGLSTFAEDQPAQSYTFTKEKMGIPAVLKAVVGHKVGSRVQVIAAPQDAFKSQGGNAQLGVGNGDTVLFVIDIVGKTLSEPEGKAFHPAGAPKVKMADGKPTGFFLPGMDPVGATTKVYTLIEGTGPAVKKGQTISANYLGQAIGGQVFDSSYTRGEPASFPIGTGGVVKGWDKGLVGVKVGSRVVLVIPSEEGYGKEGNGSSIKPNADLVFVVDVLGAV